MESETDVNLDSQKSIGNHYQHLVGFAVAYALVGLLGALAFENWVGVNLIAAIVVSTSVLVASWSVFGPGSYLKRFFLAHLIGAIPVSGLFIGFIPSVWGGFSLNIFTSDWNLPILLYAFVISLGSQFPFWIMRGLFGWQLVHRNSPPSAAFSLRDVFVLTFLCAFAAAIPQFVIQLDSNSKYSASDYGEVIVTDMIESSDGTSVPYQRKLTPEEVKQHWLDSRKNQRALTFERYGWTTAVAFVISLLAMPIMFFAFRSNEVSGGCAFSLIYVFSIWLLVTVVSGASSGLQGLNFNDFITFAIALGLSSLACILPMSASRKIGFQLTTPKRFRGASTS